MPPKPSAAPILQAIRSVLTRTKIIDASVGMFIGSIGLAMAFYPGGTWWDPTYPGHHFWQNFLCDLLHHRSLGGHPNAMSARLAAIGMLVLGFGILSAFSLANEVIPSRRKLGRGIAWCGSLGTMMLCFAALLPSDVHPRLHSASVLIGSIPSLGAYAVLVGGMLLEPVVSRLLRALSLMLLVFSVTTLSLYAWNVLFHGPSLRILPTFERLANGLLLVWLMMAARLVRQRLFSTYLALTKHRNRSLAMR